MVDLIVEGIAAGELPADLDPVLTSEVLAGPIFYRRLMTGEPFAPRLRPPDRRPRAPTPDLMKFRRSYGVVSALKMWC